MCIADARGAASLYFAKEYVEQTKRFYCYLLFNICALIQEGSGTGV